MPTEQLKKPCYDIKLKEITIDRKTNTEARENL